MHLAHEPVYLASGLYFPINNFPRFVAIGVSLIPLSLALDAMRQLMLPGGAIVGLLPVRLEIAVLLALTIVFVTAAYYLLIYVERLARAEGRLTDAHLLNGGTRDAGVASSAYSRLARVAD